VSLTLSAIWLSGPTLSQPVEDVSAAFARGDTRNGQLALLSPLAILISAIGSWMLAWKAIASNRDTAQKKSTFDYLSRLRWDKDFIEAQRTYITCRNADKKLSRLAEEYEALVNLPDLSDEQREIIRQHDCIKRLLNEYEAIAVGISTGSLSEEVVRREIRQTIIATVRDLERFVEVTRKNASAKGYRNTDALYREYTDLVRRWSPEGID
jgi:hypothetical protein